MFFPIADDNKGVSGPAYVTWGLLAINIAVFLIQLSDESITYGWSIIPKEITTGVDLVEPQIVSVDGKDHTIPQAPGPPILYLTLFTHMFMHGGIAHIVGNMLYLWIFGDNVEHRFGHAPFLVFYVVAGLVAAVSQLVFNPDSVLPNVGASGAIGGILGAYLVLFPRNQVKAVVFYFVVSVPAVAVLGLWAALQIFQGIGSISAASNVGGVAYWAHIGGLAAGIVMGLICRMLMKEEPDSIIYREYNADPNSKRWW